MRTGVTRGPAAPLRLVFAHCFGGSGASWAPLLGALGPGLDTAAPSLAGFGGTALAASAPSLDVYADQLLALAGSGPFVLVGHSMGGKIALHLAARRPAGLSGLVLIAPSPPTPEPMTEQARQKTMAAHGDRQAAVALMQKLVHVALPADLLQRCVDDEVNVALPAWRWWLQTGTRLDISAAAMGLSLPTLVITGDDDDVMGPDTAPAVARLLPLAELRVIPGGGHLLCLDQPTEVAAHLRAFLRSICAVPAPPG